jgi:hypothetical protein
MFIEVHAYIAQKRQDAREAYDYARAIGTPEPTNADLNLFLELTNGDVFSVSQDERDQIVYNIIHGA